MIIIFILGLEAFFISLYFTDSGSELYQYLLAHRSGEKSDTFIKKKKTC